MVESKSSGTLTDREKNAFSFHLKEFECLRSEIMALDAAKRKLQLIGLGAWAAVWGYLLSTEIENNIVFIVVVLASTLMLCIVFYTWNIYIDNAKRIGRYIMTIEGHYAISQIGWEHFLVEERKLAGGSIASKREKYIWSCLVVLSVGLSAVVLIERFWPKS